MPVASLDKLDASPLPAGLLGAFVGAPMLLLAGLVTVRLGEEEGVRAGLWDHRSGRAQLTVGPLSQERKMSRASQKSQNMTMRL